MKRATSGMDMNGNIAALLRDFAAVQKSKQKMWGYKRAARSILSLEDPIESFLQPDGTLRKIPNIGPASTRIILEVLTTGTSATIEEAIAASDQGSEIERRRDLRGHFLSRAQVLANFDKNVAGAKAVLASTNDEHLMKPWSLKMGGKTILTMPRVAVVRNFVLNHNIHHRAQLGVYLRLNDIPVPSVYGPSADEGSMG